MAWITPKDWEDNELVTAEKLNTHLRDNLMFLYQPPAAKVSNSSTPSSGSLVTPGFTTELFDNDAIHDPDTDNSRLTCKTAGKYLVVANVSFDANGTGARLLQIRVNGSTIVAGQVVASGSSGWNTRLSASAICDLAVNDYVQMQIEQTSGGSLGASFDFSMIRVG